MLVREPISVLLVVLCSWLLSGCGPPETANGDLGVLVFQLDGTRTLDPTREAIAVGTTTPVLRKLGRCSMRGVGRCDGGVVRMRSDLPGQPR